MAFKYSIKVLKYSAISNYNISIRVNKKKLFSTFPLWPQPHLIISDDAAQDSGHVKPGGLAHTYGYLTADF